MSRLFVYFSRQLLSTVLLVWLVLLALDVALAFFGEVQDIGRGRYGLPEVFQVIGLTLPGRAGGLLPMAALIGGLLGVGSLATQGELVAARASGLSRVRFITWIVALGFVMSVAVTWLDESVAPAAERRAGVLRTQAIFDRVAVQDDLGIWLRDGARYLHIGSVAGSTSLQNIEVFEFDDEQGLQRASRIKTAHYDGENWQLQAIQQTRFRDARIEITNTPQQTWPQLVEPALVKVLTREPEYMTLTELRRYIQYLDNNRVGSRRYQLDFWSRLVRPVTVIVMFVLGAAFVLGIRQRQSAGRRLFLGMLAGLGFKLVNDLLAQAGLVYGLAPLASALTPTLLVMLASFWMLRRVT